MLTPTIHLNGDSRETLQNGACAAIIAIQDALRAIGRVAPNGRNYYPQGPQAIGVAMRDFRAMVANLESVQAELDALAIAICDSGTVAT